MILSFTFLELGQEAMTSGLAWLTPVCLRSNMLDKALPCSPPVECHIQGSGRCTIRFLWNVNHNEKCAHSGRWRVAAFFRLFMKHLVLGTPGLAASGVAIRLGGEDIMLFAKLGAILADGEGHAKVFDWKGASALKPCLRHYNVCRKVATMQTTDGYSIPSAAISHRRHRSRDCAVVGRAAVLIVHPASGTAAITMSVGVSCAMGCLHCAKGS